MTGWRIPLRIARREATRAKGRSLLMLVMIALPVMGVSAADILIQTQDVSSVESLDRRLGTEAAAKVFLGSSVSAQQQSLDPERGGSGSLGDLSSKPTLAAVLSTLGGGRSGTTVVHSYPAVRTAKGVVEDVAGTELDPGDPLSRGFFTLSEGRWPRNNHEVVVNKALADRGPGLGDDLEITSGSDRARSAATDLTKKVVGIAESTSTRSLGQIVGLPGSLPPRDADETFWLVSGGAVTWDDVQKLNAIGALVVSRSAILHPDAEARAAEADLGFQQPIDQNVITVAILVVVMALIEVVLLAGPAFAVGARRQARPLALLAACGGTPQQARRVVLATGVVIGTVGAVAGVVLGVVGARVLDPVLQQFFSDWFGPFQVPWPHLAGVAAFGFLSALLAAVVPAVIASRQDVVAVLAGRRGDRRLSTRSPYVGVLLLVAGAGLAWVGTTQQAVSSAVSLAVSAICCVLGMLFLVPVVIGGVAGVGRHLPLTLRFAVRDAARHGTRTTPAVAAVAATVMGVVALGIGVSSDVAGDRARYTPQLPMGNASLGSNSLPADKVPWREYAKVVTAEAPGVSAEPIHGIPLGGKDLDKSVYFTRPDASDSGMYSYESAFGTSILTYDGTLPSFLSDLDGFDVAVATRVLAAGGVVVFANDGRPLPKAVVRIESSPSEGGDAGQFVEPEVTTRTVPAVAMNLHGRAPGLGIMPAALARHLGLHPETVNLLITGPRISESQEKDISERLNTFTPNGYLYVERGFTPPSDTLLIYLVLAGLGVVLMLGGTLTATFLALSDARPDLATLSAVGAAPRTRRGVAAAYALAVGGVGAVLGVLVGFVPGIAATYPLTSANRIACGDAEACALMPDHYLDVPWLLIGGVVLLLPLVVAGLVWVFARSRLPLVSRLS